MKVLVIALLCIVVYQSEESRLFLSDQLQNASEFVRPGNQPPIRVTFPRN